MNEHFYRNHYSRAGYSQWEYAQITLGPRKGFVPDRRGRKPLGGWDDPAWDCLVWEANPKGWEDAHHLDVGRVAFASARYLEVPNFARLVNDAGTRGWELVAALPILLDKFALILKRPLEDRHDEASRQESSRRWTEEMKELEERHAAAEAERQQQLAERAARKAEKQARKAAWAERRAAFGRRKAELAAKRADADSQWRAELLELVDGGAGGFAFSADDAKEAKRVHHEIRRLVDRAAALVSEAGHWEAWMRVDRTASDVTVRRLIEDGARWPIRGGVAAAVVATSAGTD